MHIAYGFGGAEQTTANLLNYLDRHRIHRITLAAPAVLKPYLPDKYDDFIDVTAKGLHGGFSSARGLYQQARLAAGLLRETVPDLALGMMHYPSALVALGAKLAGVPTRVVASYRGPFYEYMRYHEHGFRRCLFLWTAVAGAARLADRVIVPSQGTVTELQQRFFTPKHKSVAIPNGIDLALVERDADMAVPELVDLVDDSTPVLCAAARLVPEKNFGLLLEAFRQVRAQRPAILLILGDGSERARLERKIASWELNNAVRFIGYRANIMPYLRRADMFIHTCLFEGFGYTLLEALACGTAVISTDCPYGPYEVLDGGQYGILTPPGDSSALAVAILRLIDDPAGRQALIKKGLERAQQLSAQRMVKAYENEFLSLVAA
ncbi:MAG: hypothetical protein CSA09_05190 [Candidatus Contendobacter odensis]|uniref:G protein gamma domain-containing protein n=1 Tax=Candidatus Contendibacter odensensis TaxID=1400860 RepID=A0A2G6PE18_9GAMM|nr:MAG: hypothetical protein CSA09_05190 [Candidatus Contendobacter odensis]